MLLFGFGVVLARIPATTSQKTLEGSGSCNGQDSEPLVRNRGTQRQDEGRWAKGSLLGLEFRV